MTAGLETDERSAVARTWPEQYEQGLDSGVRIGAEWAVEQAQPHHLQAMAEGTIDQRAYAGSLPHFLSTEYPQQYPHGWWLEETNHLDDVTACDWLSDSKRGAFVDGFECGFLCSVQAVWAKRKPADEAADADTGNSGDGAAEEISADAETAPADDDE